MRRLWTLLTALLLASLLPRLTQAATGTIRGRVVSALGHAPLVDVDVSVPIAQRGTRTAEDGSCVQLVLAGLAGLSPARLTPRGPGAWAGRASGPS